MDANRWEVSDASGATHVVSVRKGMLGTTSLRVDGRQLMNLAGEGIVAFEVAGRQARLSPQPGGTGYDFAVGSITAQALAAPAAGPAGAAAPVASGRTGALHLTQRRDRGASWFFWIGGLSLVNTVLAMIGSSIGFATGLGLTEYFAGIVYVLAGESWLWLALFLDLPFVALLFWFGVLARRGATWPFLVGGVFYAVDLFLVLTLEDWVGAIIHVLALFSFFTGWRAARALARLGESPAPLAA